MPQPIYLLILAKAYTEAWYQLSKQEQDDLWEKVKAIDDEAGATWQLMCDSRWADEEMPLWGVIEYPNLEAYQRKVAALEAMDWWRYVSTKRSSGRSRWSKQSNMLIGKAALERSTFHS